MQISEKSLDQAMEYLFSEKSLEEILRMGRRYLERTKDNKVYVQQNDMRTLLSSGRATIRDEGAQYSGTFSICVKYEGIVFTHSAQNAWWKAQRAPVEADYNPLSGRFGP